MKKIILGLVVILIVGMATAQEKKTFGFAKNDMLLGGSLNCFTRKYDDDHSTFYCGVSPTLGYFIKDNFAVGVNLGLGYQRSENEAMGRTEKEYIYGFSAFGRYYFWELGKRFKAYNQVNLGYNRRNSKYENINFKYPTPEDSHRDVCKLNAGVGVNYFITKNLALNFYLSDLIEYTYTKEEDNKIEKKVELNLNNFYSYRFGIVYKF